MPASQTSWACFAMRTHAFFTHPTIQPLRKLQPPGTIWRTACGEHSAPAHSLANKARLIILDRQHGAPAHGLGRRLKSHLSLRLYQRKIPTDLSGELGELHLTSPVGVGPHTHPPTQKGIRYLIAYTPTLI